MLKKLWATKQIYDIVVRAIDERQRNGTPKSDTLQMLLDEQDERLVIVGVGLSFVMVFRLADFQQFIMGLLVAGARATGTSASWLITYLGDHECKDAVIAEVEQLLANYASQSDSYSLSQQLASIPLEAWESETPVLDSLIRETLRIAQPHTAMRRNLGPDVTIDGRTIPSGAYLVYPFSDVHLNPELYPDPWRFDPSRKEVTAPFGYLGWGGGELHGSLRFLSI